MIDDVTFSKELKGRTNRSFLSSQACQIGQIQVVTGAKRKERQAEDLMF